MGEWIKKRFRSSMEMFVCFKSGSKNLVQSSIAANYVMWDDFFGS